VLVGAVQAPERSGTIGLYRNSVLWIEPGRGIVESFDKTHAVPLVESGRSAPLASLLGLSGLGRFVEEGSVQRPFQAGAAELAVALCYEVLFPGLVAARRTPATLAILNLANDSWFPAETPSLQQVAFASFRAIEQRLSLVRVAHGGISAVIDPYGRVQASLAFVASGTLRTSLLNSPPASLVERAALLALLGLCGLLGYGIAAALTRRRHS
jgi:apolipoprotein N-acyltransferase